MDQVQVDLVALVLIPKVQEQTVVAVAVQARPLVAGLVLVASVDQVEEQVGVFQGDYLVEAAVVSILLLVLAVAEELWLGLTI
jgi:hypothetical protein